MNFCSPFTSLKVHSELNQQPQLNRDYQQFGMNFGPDTNIFLIEFDFLKNAQNNIVLGDPTICKGCKAVFNVHSKLSTKEEILQHIPKLQIIKEEEGQEDQMKSSIKFDTAATKLKDISSEQQLWYCEFCDEINVVSLEKEEIPVKDDMIYIVQNAESKENQKQDMDEKEYCVIFCLDNSGSMSATSEMMGKVALNHGLTKEEYEMLKQFIDPGDENQFYPGFNNRNVTYVSRKQCVLAALEEQLQNIKKQNSKRKVGLITFNNEVQLIGDGFSNLIVLAGDKLMNEASIQQMVQQNVQNLLQKEVNESSDKLLQQFKTLENKGATALGPALLASVELAGGYEKGSIVVICTDGLANIGLGNLDTEDKIEQSSQFYDNICSLAKEKGVVINLVSIKGEGCKLEQLTKLTERTNGNVNRVSPTDLSKKFANILQDEIVGFEVLLNVQLHKALQFRHADQQFLKQNNSVYEQEIGNATTSTKVSFEYQLKSNQQLTQLGINYKNLKVIPFQAQIHYTTTEGHKYLRVVTKTCKGTLEEAISEQHCDVGVMSMRIAQHSGTQMLSHNTEEASKYNRLYTNFMQKPSIQSVPANYQKSNQFMQVNSKFERIVSKRSEPLSSHMQTDSYPQSQNSVKNQLLDEEADLDMNLSAPIIREEEEINLRESKKEKVERKAQEEEEINLRESKKEKVERKAQFPIQSGKQKQTKMKNVQQKKSKQIEKKEDQIEKEVKQMNSGSSDDDDEAYLTSIKQAKY